MSFTHYPKNYNNLVLAWVYPDIQPLNPVTYTHGKRTKVRPHWNNLTSPLEVGKTVNFYHDARNFTRFFGSVFADVPLVVNISFSNDEFHVSGSHPTDELLPELNYDADSLTVKYDPDNPVASKIISMINGNWIKVSIKRTGDASVSCNNLRIFLRGSVF